MLEVLDLYSKYLSLLLNASWIWSPVCLCVIFFESWMYYIQRVWWGKLDWVILEIKPPRDIESTPKAMEQIFAGLWGAFGTVSTKYQKYFLGMKQDYFSCEIVGINGEIHFYIRGLRKYRDMVEAQVYSQYSHAEIREVPDYVFNVPLNLPNKNWDMWGCKLELDREDYYPLRTYPLLIDLTKTDQPFLDPLAGLMEVMSKLRQGEQIWIQILLRPIEDKWREKARALADKLFGRQPKPKAEGLIKFDIRTWFESISNVLHEIFTNQPGPYAGVVEEEKKDRALLMMLSPVERDIVAGIEEKAGKKGFGCKVQWGYLFKKEMMSMGNVAAVMGIINQFAHLNMNSLKPVRKTITARAYYLFTEQRKFYKKRVLMRWMRSRSLWEDGYILNIEELASLYHFPTIGVKAPATPYIDVKKGGPPVDLPML